MPLPAKGNWRVWSLFYLADKTRRYIYASASQHRLPRRLWLEILGLAIALVVLITLFDYWLTGKLSQATLSALTRGGWL
jgi:hypothetical protein